MSQLPCHMSPFYAFHQVLYEEEGLGFGLGGLIGEGEIKVEDWGRMGVGEDSEGEDGVLGLGGVKREEGWEGWDDGNEEEEDWGEMEGQGDWGFKVKVEEQEGYEYRDDEKVGQDPFHYQNDARRVTATTLRPLKSTTKPTMKPSKKTKRSKIQLLRLGEVDYNIGSLKAIASSLCKFVNKFHQIGYNQLMQKFIEDNPKQAKNLKRRMYDVINVLHAAKVFRKCGSLLCKNQSLLLFANTNLFTIEEKTQQRKNMLKKIHQQQGQKLKSIKSKQALLSELKAKKRKLLASPQHKKYLPEVLVPIPSVICLLNADQSKPISQCVTIDDKKIAIANVIKFQIIASKQQQENTRFAMPLGARVQVIDVPRYGERLRERVVKDEVKVEEILYL